MLKHRLLEDYRRQWDQFEAWRKVLHAHLEGLLERQGLKSMVHPVTSRVKAVSSLGHKLARPDRTYQRLEDITDLVGLRVVTYFEDTIEQVAQLIEAHFPVDRERSVDKRRLQDPSSFGYRSLHFICHPPPGLLAGSPERSWPFEIQIRTILQHAWAEIEHEQGYKSPEAVPLPVRRRFSRLAGLLELADSEFVELKRTIAAYSQQVRQSAALEQEHLELDKVSLGWLMESAPVAELDRALATHLGKRLEAELFYPEYVIRMLAAVELRRPSEVLQRLPEFAPRLLEFAERYFRFTAEVFGIGAQDMDSVQRGYCLLLLAHWQALSQEAQEPQQVERMRAFYQQVDYSRDEEEAQRVARLFVRRLTRG